MQEPENWEFLRWRDERTMEVSVNGRATLVQSHMKPFFDIVAAAHGPYHEPTEAELERIAQRRKKVNAGRNKSYLNESLRGVSSAVDNPSFWNRLSPKIKSDMLTYFRVLLELREHPNFDGSGRIESEITPPPYHDTLEDNNSTPHREFGLIISCLLYTSPSPRDRQKSRMPSSA